MNLCNLRSLRIALCFLLASSSLVAQEPHARPQKQEVPGKRVPLSCAGRELTLYLPPGLKLRDGVPLAVHFHGAIWVAEWNLWRSGKKAALLPIHIGVGSRVYRQAFADSEEFGRLLSCVETALGHKVGKVVLTSFSAGYGAIAEILAVPRWRDRVAAVLLADSLHSSYVPEGQPGKAEHRAAPAVRRIPGRVVGHALTDCARRLRLDHGNGRLPYPAARRPAPCRHPH